MREIVEALGGRIATLTLHPDDGGEARVLHADDGIEPAALIRLLGSGDAVLADGEDHRWVRCEDRFPHSDAIILAVERVRGHSRLLITVFFDRPTAAERAKAEAVYRSRRPFAIGYFRLWQAERANARLRLSMQAALDLVAIGIILFTRTGAVAFANQSARDMLRSGEGIRMRDDQVHAAIRDDDSRLRVAIGHVAAASGAPDTASRAPLLSVRRDGKPPLMVAVLPSAHPAEEPSDIAAIMFAVDPAVETEQLLESVCEVYGLTRVETRLACLLATGATLAEAATAMRVKEQSARGYLKQVFVKTGTNRQADLMRVMLTSLVRNARGIAGEVI